ncbi:hypothetical protein SAMD00079811_15890 [Scytonema sp. HK-05]|nr:hypothetical protein NIES2130_15065 [Scytonema sp. HK-05]BAY43995.1 hypothetical protein SAMD00079811_15890 [Scytonema sp. HK-05]
MLFCFSPRLTIAYLPEEVGAVGVDSVVGVVGVPLVDVVGVLPVDVLALELLEGRREVFFPVVEVPGFFFLPVEGLVVVLPGLVIPPDVVAPGVVAPGVVAPGVVGEGVCACTVGAVRATGAATTTDRSKAFAILSI